MLTAKEALDKTYHPVIEFVSDEQKIVEKEILAHIDVGMTGYFFDGILSKRTRQWLNDLGYVVKLHYKEKKTFISWLVSS